MKRNKSDKLAAKVIGRMAVNSIGNQLAEFMVTVKEAGISKKDGKKLTSDILKKILNKVAKNPEKYVHSHASAR